MGNIIYCTPVKKLSVQCVPNLLESFVDYNKAFGTIEHENFWKAIKNQGIEISYIQILNSIHGRSTA